MVIRSFHGGDASERYYYRALRNASVVFIARGRSLDALLSSAIKPYRLWTPSRKNSGSSRLASHSHIFFSLGEMWRCCAVCINFLTDTLDERVVWGDEQQQQLCHRVVWEVHASNGSDRTDVFHYGKNIVILMC